MGVFRAGTIAGGLRLADAGSVLAAARLARGDVEEAERMRLASLGRLRARSGQRARGTAWRLVRLYEAAGQQPQVAEHSAFLESMDAEAGAELARIAGRTSQGR